jgi:prepilin-type N-terminal cleavage/methylation domain-containing protein
MIYKNLKLKKGFTLIELLVVVSIIGLLASIVLTALSSARGRAADAFRISEIHQLQIALDLYYNTHGQYPAGVDDAGVCGYGGYDTTCDSSFISALNADGLFPLTIKDSKDTGTSLSNTVPGGNYMYYKYPAGGLSGNGCPVSNGPFYVLIVVKTDTYGTAKHPQSPGFSCSGRDWQTGVSYVVGKYEQ